MKNGFVLAVALLSFLSWNAWAVDETVVLGLKEEVSNAKIKAEQAAAEIQSMKGGLPAESSARQAMDERLQRQINALQVQADYNTESIGTLEDDLAVNLQGWQNTGADLQEQIETLQDGLAEEAKVREEALADIEDRIEHMERAPLVSLDSLAGLPCNVGGPGEGTVVLTYGDVDANGLMTIGLACQTTVYTLEVALIAERADSWDRPIQFTVSSDPAGIDVTAGGFEHSSSETESATFFGGVQVTLWSVGGYAATFYGCDPYPNIPQLGACELNMNADRKVTVRH